MTSLSALPEMSAEESEWLDSIFNPKFHGEIRLENNKSANKLTINWFDNYIFSYSKLDINTHNDEMWADAVTRVHEEYDKTRAENKLLIKEVALLKSKLYSSSTEQNKVKDLAVNNDEQNSLISAPVKSAEIIKLNSKNAGRKPLPPELPRESITYQLPTKEQICPCCVGTLSRCGEEVFERISVIPEHYRVIKHIQYKYVCRACNQFSVAPAPKSILPGSSFGSPEFLASVAVKRFQHGLPYYRQEQIFNSMGLPFNRTTLTSLMINTADKLTSVYELLKEELRSQSIIHADETRFQVLKEPNRKPETNSFLWLYCSASNALKPVVLYEYQETRSSEHPKRFLSGDRTDSFSGYLCVDGYAGYNKIPNVIRVGCMAHVRRKFSDILKSLPSEAEGTYAAQALDMIGALYGIEKKILHDPPDKKYLIRQTQSLPILNQIKAWLDELQNQVTPKSPLGKAVSYAFEQWYAVSRYVDDGRLAIDNNIAERAIKSFVIGRKNWLFADSADGAYASAVMYSLVNTAKANGIDPYRYLYYLFGKLPYAKTTEDVRALMPWLMNDAQNSHQLLAA